MRRCSSSGNRTAGGCAVSPECPAPSLGTEPPGTASPQPGVKGMPLTTWPLASFFSGSFISFISFTSVLLKELSLSWDRSHWNLWWKINHLGHEILLNLEWHHDLWCQRGMSVNPHAVGLRRSHLSSNWSIFWGMKQTQTFGITLRTAVWVPPPKVILPKTRLTKKRARRYTSKSNGSTSDFLVIETHHLGIMVPNMCYQTWSSLSKCDMWRVNNVAQWMFTPESLDYLRENKELLGGSSCKLSTFSVATTSFLGL